MNKPGLKISLRLLSVLISFWGIIDMVLARLGSVRRKKSKASGREVACHSCTSCGYIPEND